MNGNKRLATLLSLLLLVAACAASTASHPTVVLDETVCSHCGMLVSDVSHAAGIVTAGGTQKVYDDIVCLLGSQDGRNAATETVWFHAFDEDRWIPAATASFISQKKVRGPMGGDILAYASTERAAGAARTLGGEVIPSFDGLQEKGVQP